jgi:hypothetical protein
VRVCGLDDFAHNLMARYEVREELRKFSSDDVQVCSADAARFHFQ